MNHLLKNQKNRNENPKKSNQGIVLQIHITDKELIDKIGKTGRTEDERKKIEEASGYNSEASRMIIAESGLIAPGYLFVQHAVARHVSHQDPICRFFILMKIIR